MFKQSKEKQKEREKRDAEIEAEQRQWTLNRLHENTRIKEQLLDKDILDLYGLDLTTRLQYQIVREIKALNAKLTAKDVEA